MGWFALLCWLVLVGRFGGVSSSFSRGLQLRQGHFCAPQPRELVLGLFCWCSAMPQLWWPRPQGPTGPCMPRVMLVLPWASCCLSGMPEESCFFALWTEHGFDASHHVPNYCKQVFSAVVYSCSLYSFGEYLMCIWTCTHQNRPACLLAQPLSPTPWPDSTTAQRRPRVFF